MPKRSSLLSMFLVSNRQAFTDIHLCFPPLYFWFLLYGAHTYSSPSLPSITTPAVTEPALLVGEFRDLRWIYDVGIRTGMQHTG